TRRLALADRARSSMGHGVAVRGHAACEIVALNRAGEPFAERRARDIDQVAGLEEVRLELRAGLQIGVGSLFETKFDQAAPRGDARLGEVAGECLGEQLRAPRAPG